MIDYLFWLLVRIAKYIWIIFAEIVLWSVFCFGIIQSIPIVAVVSYAINTAFVLSMVFFFVTEKWKKDDEND